jgi:hypothetical protein
MILCSVNSFVKYWLLLELELTPINNFGHSLSKFHTLFVSELHSLHYLQSGWESTVNTVKDKVVPVLYLSTTP